MTISLQKWSVATICTFSIAAHAQVAVVAGSKSPITSMTAEQAANLFLGKSDQLPGGGNAVLYDQNEGSAVREAFYTKVTGKSAPQVKAAWARTVFSGKGTPPKEKANSTEVKKALSSNANAIGYIEKNAVDASVKVILLAE